MNPPSTRVCSIEQDLLEERFSNVSPNQILQVSQSQALEAENTLASHLYIHPDVLRSAGTALSTTSKIPIDGVLDIVQTIV
jgi:hypothetical protein